MTYWSQSCIETNTKTAVWKMTQLGLIDSKISKILVLMKFHCQICYKEIPLLYPSRLTVLFERSIDKGSFQKVNAKNIWNFPYVGRPPFSVRYRKLMENEVYSHPSFDLDPFKRKEKKVDFIHIFLFILIHIVYILLDKIKSKRNLINK